MRFTIITLSFTCLLTLLSCRSSPSLDYTELFPVRSAVGTDKIEIDPNIQTFQDPQTHLIGFRGKNNNKVLVSPRYQYAYEFNKYGITDVLFSNQKGWQKINRDGKFLVKPYLFDNGPDYYVSGLSRYESNGKIGFVDVKGQIVIPARFNWASPFFFSIPIAMVCTGCIPEETKLGQKGCFHFDIKGGKWGGIDMNGSLVIPLDYTGYSFDEDGEVILFKENEKYKLYANNKKNYFLRKIKTE